MWSADPSSCGRFPARFLAEFFDNHGMLGFRGPPAVADGQRRLARYVEALTRAVRATACASRTPVARDRAPADDDVLVTPRGGEPERFDEVVLATHSDQALALLGRRRPTREHELLGAIPYQPNEAVLHTDDAACCRAAGARGRAGTTTCSTRPVERDRPSPTT